MTASSCLETRQRLIGPPITLTEKSLNAHLKDETSPPTASDGLGVVGPPMTSRENDLDLDTLAGLNVSPLARLNEGYAIHSCMENGPPIDAQEKTILDGDELFISRLYDLSDPVRQQFLRQLREATTGTFHSGGYEGYTKDQWTSLFLSLCPSPKHFSLAVRTPFIHGHTPLVWAITRIPEGWSTLPYDRLPGFPLIAFLAEWALTGLEDRAAIADLYETAAEACCDIGVNSLFQYFNIRAQGIPKPTFPTFHYFVTHQNKEEDYRFIIHDFDSQMQKQRLVDLRVVFQGHVVSLAFGETVAGWTLSAKTITQNSRKPSLRPFGERKTLKVAILKKSPYIPVKEGCCFNLSIDGSLQATSCSKISLARLQNNRSKFIQVDGSLQGHLRFRKATIFGSTG